MTQLKKKDSNDENSWANFGPRLKVAQAVWGGGDEDEERPRWSAHEKFDTRLAAVAAETRAPGTDYIYIHVHIDIDIDIGNFYHADMHARKQGAPALLQVYVLYYL